MILEIEELLANAIESSTAAGGLSGTNNELGNIIGNAMSGVFSGLQNLFTGASAGSSISGTLLASSANTLQTQMPTLNPSQITEANEFLTKYDTIITALGSTADIDKAVTNINDIIKSDAKIKPIIEKLKEIISFGKYSITQTGNGITWNFVSIESTNGFSGEKNQISEIEDWYYQILSAMEDLGYISYEAKHIQPSNFLVHGFNAAGMILDGVQEQTWITKFIQSLNDAYSQFDNLVDYVEGEVRAIIAAADKVISVPALTGTETGSPFDWESLTLEDLEKLIALFALSFSITRTIRNDDDNNRNKKKRRRKKIKKKKQKKTKNPKYISSISLETPTSNWIRRIEFRFPVKKDIKSDDRGTMTFILKKGGSISKVRVKRGTFSVIAMWSQGTSFGVGYRYWSQFNKKAIVNRRKVFSWFIPIIKPQDRKIAIPMEIKEKMIKYK